MHLIHEPTLLHVVNFIVQLDSEWHCLYFKMKY